MTVSSPKARDNSLAAPAGELLISDSFLSKLSEFVADKMGLHFPKERWRDLEKGIASAAREFGFNDAESCIQRLTSFPLTKNQIETLASHLTVGETYFFREEKTFEIFEERIFSELIRSRVSIEKRLRIWSAGCSTGEEPYSIAILLNKMIPDLKDWNITILATDINPRFLRKAYDGIYSEWSFRNTPLWVKERYFKKAEGNRLEILPHIKNMVTFSYHNLAEDDYPSLSSNTNAMDVILCRNVLMYFNLESQKKVIRHLHRCLVDSGCLIVSPSETSNILYSQFKAENLSNVIFYRKISEPHLKSESVIEELMPETFGNEEAIFHPEDEITIHGEIPEFSISGESESIAAEPAADPYTEGFALYKDGLYTEAETKITSLLNSNQNNPSALMLLSRIYANQGKLSEAVQFCERAIATDKLNPGGHYLLATILQEQGHIEGATASLKRALYLNQDFVLAHFALGNLNRGHSRFREAERYFRNAHSLLSRYRREDILPESDGMTAGRLTEIIEASIGGINGRQ